MSESPEQPAIAASKLHAVAREAVSAADAVLREATAAVRRRIGTHGEHLREGEQRATHGLAWLATYVESVRQLCVHAERLDAGGQFGEDEQLAVRLGLSEYLGQIVGGIPMNQSEIVRPADLGLSVSEVAPRLSGAIE